MLKIISGEMISFPINTERTRLSSKFPALLFIVKGHVFISKSRTEVGEGYFLPENTVISTKTDKGVECLAVRFLLDGNDSESILSSRALDSDTPVRFTLRERESATALVHSLYDTLKDNRSDTFCEAAAKLALSLIYAEDTSAYSPTYNNAYVDRATRYISANLASELRVERIAEYLGVDRMYLRNLFVEHVGMSTMDYIMTTRINRAKELLSNDRLTVGEVSVAVGYKDVLAFSKAFKKHVGTSPSQYRNDLSKPQSRRTNDVPIFIL